ncbi:hypothetical protein Gotri_005648 [Gossypium trilobum]|uniref:Uncharacterized protein n=1 Tax=Gossypium trilobum TaxID=34281 RepID=A0A7J9EX84_9ROSI|nr:hypothetical protein [Gossypium trilobum]
MEEVLRFLTKGKEVWKYQTGVARPETFNQALMTPREKDMDEAEGTFFPHLIMELCKRVGATMEWMDKEINPLKKLLGDDVYKKFVIL